MSSSSVKTMISLDARLVFAAVTLLALGWMMVGSASISIAASKIDQPFFYFIRQGIFAGIGLLVAWVVLSINLSVWQRLAPKLLLLGLLSLIVDR